MIGSTSQMLVLYRKEELLKVSAEGMQPVTIWHPVDSTPVGPSGHLEIEIPCRKGDIMVIAPVFKILHDGVIDAVEQAPHGGWFPVMPQKSGA